MKKKKKKKKKMMMMMMMMVGRRFPIFYIYKLPIVRIRGCYVRTYMSCP